MGSNIVITKEIENYINNHSLELSTVQKEIISYNNSLGDIKRMQISISQCHFLHLIIKISNIKKILEIGTFTGLSALTMSLSLSNEGQLITIDKNVERWCYHLINKKGLIKTEFDLYYIFLSSSYAAS